MSSENSPLPVKDIENTTLNKSERILLRYLNKKKVVSIEDAKNRLRKYRNKSALVTLRWKFLISFPDNISVCITKRGENWIEYQRNELVKFLYPQVISTISLLASISAVVLSLIALMR